MRASAEGVSIPSQQMRKMKEWLTYPVNHIWVSSLGRILCWLRGNHNLSTRIR
jgi:hypothetical protein